MLSEEERRDWLEMSRSAQLRRDFERLRQAAQRRTVTLDQYVTFASMMGRFGPPPPPRPFVRYSRVLL